MFIQQFNDMFSRSVVYIYACIVSSIVAFDQSVTEVSKIYETVSNWSVQTPHMATQLPIHSYLNLGISTNVYLILYMCILI